MKRTVHRWALLSREGRIIATYADESLALSMTPKWGKAVVPCVVQYDDKVVRKTKRAKGGGR